MLCFTASITVGVCLMMSLGVAGSPRAGFYVLVGACIVTSMVLALSSGEDRIGRRRSELEDVGLMLLRPMTRSDLLLIVFGLPSAAAFYVMSMYLIDWLGIA
jgi:hypothetical protein